MKNQKNSMSVGSYFILEIELKPVGEKVLNKYGRICRAFLQKKQCPMVCGALVLAEQLFP